MGMSKQDMVRLLVIEGLYSLFLPILFVLFLANLDAVAMRRRFRVLILCTGVTSWTFWYILNRISSRHWSDHETCLWLECSTPQGIYIQAMGTVICWQWRLLVIYASGEHFANLRVDYVPMSSFA